MDAKLAPLLLKVTGKDLDVLANVVETLTDKIHPHNHLIMRLYLACVIYNSKMDISGEFAKLFNLNFMK